MKKLKINHFDGNYAICTDQDGNTDIKIPKYQLPLESKDGDLLYQDADDMYQTYEETDDI